MRVSVLVCLAAVAGCASSSSPTSPRPGSDGRASASGAGAGAGAPSDVTVTEAVSATAPAGQGSAAPAARTNGNGLASPAASATPAPDLDAPAPLPPGATAPTEASIAADVRAANGFAFSLYGRMRRAPGNLLVSGTSLRHALGGAYLGAKGDTAKEMAKVLALPAPDVAAGLGAVELDDWRKAKPPEGSVTLATRLWVDEGFAVAPAFLERAVAYGAPAERLAIGKAPEAARKSINAWVDERTGGKIPELLAKGAVDARSRMLVTNAIHVKARWVEPFPKAATKDEPFRLDASKTASVPTMHVTNGMRYAAVGATKVVELRYEGTPLSMLVVVPEEPNGLSRVEQSLSTETVERWTKALVQQKVSLAFPRFTFSAGGVMNDALRDMGMRSAFTDRADFGGILAEGSGKDRLALSQVVQRTFVAVDEVGTEAAAASGVVMRTTSLDVSTPVEVKVDRPFLFMIRDVTRGRILFVGRVADPRAGS